MGARTCSPRLRRFSPSWLDRGSDQDGTGAAVGVHVAALHRCSQASTKDSPMLYYAVVFFVLAIIAGVFGFGGIAAGAAGIGKILFVGFLVVAIVSLFVGRKARAN
jgi:uncharacterized membrane protein YtjA (UPF0391 family)